MDKALVQVAVSNLAISMVYLKRSESQMAEWFDPFVGNQELIGQFRIGTESHVRLERKDEAGMSRSFIRYHVSAGLRYLLGPLSGEPSEAEAAGITAAEITATFAADYEIQGVDGVPEDAMSEFGKFNAVFNVWPYWREYCHSECTRMSLPIIIIPPYRLPG